MADGCGIGGNNFPIFLFLILILLWSGVDGCW
ncbi:hypothetical protein Ga0451573_001896 [Peptococcaceae bacterium DYL19]|nr:hypothetical protein [Phosphitispora fastidiosa]